MIYRNETFQQNTIIRQIIANNNSICHSQKEVCIYSHPDVIMQIDQITPKLANYQVGEHNCTKCIKRDIV